MQRTTFDYLIVIIPIVISVISVIISTVNLYLTKQSIYNATKPVVTPYIEIINGLSFQKNLVIKNFGKTPARITNLKFHSKLDEFNERFKMQSVIGSFIAPGQKFSTNISDTFEDDIILTLEYIDSFGKVTTVNETLKTDFPKNLFYSSGAHPTNQPLDTAIREAAITLVNNFK